MTKTLPGSFSIRWHKNFENNLKNKFCRVEHTHTDTHIHTQRHTHRHTHTHLDTHTHTRTQLYIYRFTYPYCHVKRMLNKLLWPSSHAFRVSYGHPCFESRGSITKSLIHFSLILYKIKRKQPSYLWTYWYFNLWWSFKLE